MKNKFVSIFKLTQCIIAIFIFKFSMAWHQTPLAVLPSCICSKVNDINK